MIESPHVCSLQFVRHAAFGRFEFTPRPRSHCSPFATSTIELPHVSSDLQSAEQPAPETVLPSAQTSPGSTILSPQRGSWQFVRHLSFVFALFVPSSHTSPSVRLSMMPSPHFGSRQLARHSAFGVFELPRTTSLCSPLTTSTTPLPHVSFELQLLEQPSPLVVLPSSHTSPCSRSCTPSPQRAGRQYVRQL